VVPVAHPMEVDHLPSDFDQWVTAVRHQFRFYLRTWRFVGLLAFVLLVVVAFLVVTIVKDQAATSAATYLDAAVSNLSIFGIIIGAFIGGDAIAMDFGSGSGYYLLVLPARRVVFLLGRFTAAFVLTLGLIAIFYLFPIAGAIHFYGVAALPGGELAESFGIAVLFGLAVLATAFFFSSLFRSPAISMVVTILALFLGFLFVDGIVGSSLNVEPWFSLLYAGDAIGEPLVALPHHTSMTTQFGMRMITTYTWEPFIPEGVEILAAYFVVFLVLSAVLYSLKESKG
jgi:ABC-2 type transport system permease protein